MAQHIFTGSGAPTSTPTAVGQHYIDLTNKSAYFSAGTSSPADWKLSDASAALAAHVAEIDPHGQYITTAEGNSAYDPLGAAATVQSNLTTHINDLNNPHATTKAQVGLGNVDNTSDLNKPVSTATQSALNLKYDASNPNGYETPTQLNARDTANRSRANHTGTQTASTISDFSSAVNAIITALKGVANGLVPLDGTVKIPAIYLPSFVDDVLEYANLASFPVTGETGKMYVDLATNKAYRWSGTVYVEISASPGSTDAVPEGASNLYFTPARVLATALQGFVVGANSALAATDTVLQAFGKIQAQINNLLSVKADKTITISAGTSLNGGGDLSANRTIAHNNFGTAGTYGSASSVPVFTTEATGHVSGVTNTPIAILASAVTDFAAAVRSVVLTGLSLADQTEVADTDTILQAIGKLQAQINVWTELTQLADQNNASAVTFSALTDLGKDVVAGKTYYFEYTLLFRSTAAGTGIGLTINGSGLGGEISAIVNIPIANDGTAALYSGSITSFGDAVTATSVQTANTTFVANIKGVFKSTAVGTFYPLFRSETNGTQVRIISGSVALIREF